jgi:hypothetical protein
MILYRFRPASKFTFLELESERNWAADPFGVNDPFEFIGREPYRLVNGNLIDWTGDQLDNYSFLSGPLREFGITCFSAHRDGEINPVQNPLMWSHYAEAHKGICFVFEVEDNRDDFTPVQYSVSVPQLELLGKDSIKSDMKKLIASKSSQWSYEQEVRQVHGNKNVTVPFAGNLIEVIFGCKCSVADMNLVCKILNANARFNTRLTKMFISRNSYGLVRGTHDYEGHERGLELPPFFKNIFM